MGSIKLLRNAYSLGAKIFGKVTSQKMDEILTAWNLVYGNRTTVAYNATATVSAADLMQGVITSTSASATTLTLPTATQLATTLGATRGSIFEFLIDNSAGANTVTVSLGSGMTAATPVITGGDTLTVSTANQVGIFRVVFTSTTAAMVYRLG